MRTWNELESCKDPCDKQSVSTTNKCLVNEITQFVKQAPLCYTSITCWWFMLLIFRWSVEEWIFNMSRDWIGNITRASMDPTSHCKLRRNNHSSHTKNIRTHVNQAISFYCAAERARTQVTAGTSPQQCVDRTEVSAESTGKSITSLIMALGPCMQFLLLCSFSCMMNSSWRIQIPDVIRFIVDVNTSRSVHQSDNLLNINVRVFHSPKCCTKTLFLKIS